MEINFLRREIIADPYPYYERVRAAGRAVHNEVFDCWMLTGYTDVQTLLGDPLHFSSTIKQQMYQPGWDAATMISSDPPDHTRLRSVIQRAFTKAEVARAWERRINDVLDGLLSSDEFNDALASGGPVDVVKLVVDHLPSTIMAEFLGVPHDLREDFHRWAFEFASALTLGDAPERDEIIRRATVARDSISTLLQEQIEWHRHHPSTDLVGQLVEANENDILSDSELRAACLLLVIAGNDTTVRLIGNGIVALAQWPDQRRLLASDPTLAASALEEVLRFYSVNQANPRVVLREVEVGGAHFAAGDVIWGLTAAANRDPARMVDPNCFDIARSPNPQLSFGHGPHLCLGAMLARLEARTALTRLLQKLPEFDIDSIDYGTGFFVRGPEYIGLVPAPGRLSA